MEITSLPKERIISPNASNLDSSLESRDTIPFHRNPKKLMKEWIWVAYTIFIYLFLLEGLALSVGGLVLLVLNINEYDLLLLFFTGICQFSAFWYGHKARRELTSDHQERFWAFLKVHFELFIVLLAIFFLNFIIKGQISFDNGVPNDYARYLFVMIGHAIIYRLMYGRVKFLDDYLRKYEVSKKYITKANGTETVATEL